MRSEDIQLNYERLLKLRLAVARFGETDIARWWNTNGVLGRYGAIAISRGFPKTHRFVRARIVMTAARVRCGELFSHPDCMTLWKLPAVVEDQFESRWQQWLDAPDDWQEFFARLENQPDTGLLEILSTLDLITPAQTGQVGTLQRSAMGWTVPLPSVYQPDDGTIALLAAAFALGETGKPVVPYARLEGHS